MADIHRAALAGNVEEVRALIEAGVDIRELNEEGFPPLIVSILPSAEKSREDVESIVELLLKAGVDKDIDTPYRNGETPFMAACTEGRVEIVKKLKEAGSPNLDRRYANDNGQIDEIAIRLKNRPRDMKMTKIVDGKEVTTSDVEEIRKQLGEHPDDQTNRYMEIVKLLIGWGIDVKAEIKRTQQTALFTATGCDVAPLVEILISAGLDVNKRDNNGLAPLHYAARKGLAEIIDMLLAAGADVNAQDSWGFTALHEAALSGLVDTVKKLIDVGADKSIGLLKDYDAQYKKGCTAKQAAEIFGKRRVVGLL